MNRGVAEDAEGVGRNWREASSFTMPWGFVLCS